jgi:hypothetical protein
MIEETQETEEEEIDAVVSNNNNNKKRSSKERWTAQSRRDLSDQSSALSAMVCILRTNALSANNQPSEKRAAMRKNDMPI